MISESRCEQSDALGDRGCLHPGTDAELAPDVGDVHVAVFVLTKQRPPISRVRFALGDQQHRQFPIGQPELLRRRANTSFRKPSA
jgi:hypothetical protein